MVIEASVKSKIKSLEKEGVKSMEFFREKSITEEEGIKDENKFITKLKSLNGKTLILIGVLIPIILLLLFGESYNPGPYSNQHNSYVDYLTNANLVFYDELQSLEAQARANGKRFLGTDRYMKIQVPISIILALGLVVIGIGIYKLLNKPKET